MDSADRRRDTTCVMFYAIFSHGRATSTKVLIALLVALLATFVTLYYHYLPILSGRTLSSSFNLCQMIDIEKLMHCVRCLGVVESNDRS
jgi:hypothetical protein